MTLLKEKCIDSKESLMELSNILDKLSACGTSDAMDKINFTNAVTILKVEAGSLLEEINFYAASIAHGNVILDSVYDLESIFEDFSFKERLHDLNQKVLSLSFKNPA